MHHVLLPNLGPEGRPSPRVRSVFTRRATSLDEARLSNQRGWAHRFQALRKAAERPQCGFIWGVGERERLRSSRGPERTRGGGTTPQTLTLLRRQGSDPKRVRVACCPTCRASSWITCSRAWHRDRILMTGSAAGIASDWRVTARIGVMTVPLRQAMRSRRRCRTRCSVDLDSVLRTVRSLHTRRLRCGTGPPLIGSHLLLQYQTGFSDAYSSPPPMRILGSRTSRSASPKRFRARAAMKIANPGATENHGAARR